MKRKAKADLLKEIEQLQRRLAELEDEGSARSLDKGESVIDEGQYRVIVQTSLDGFWIHDLEGRFVDVNDAYCQMVGYSREELLRMRIPDVEALEEPEETARHIRKVVEKGYDRFETRQRRKDGEIVDLEVSTTYSDLRGGQLFVFLRDITERKRAEEALRESQGRYRRIADTAREGIWVIDTEAVTTFVNPSMAAMFGFSAKEMLGRSLFEFMDEEAQTDAKHFFERRRQGISEQHDFRFRRKDGSTIWTIVNTNPIVSAEGKIIGALGMVTDITERKQAEEALRASEEKYRRLFEELNDAAFLADADTGILLDANAQAEMLLGRTREETIGMHQSELHPPGEAELYRKQFAEHVRGYPAALDGEVVRKDGTTVPVVMSAQTMEISGQHLILGLFRDITELKRAEEAIAWLARFPSEDPNPVLRIAADGTILYSNPPGAPLLEAWGCQPGVVLSGQPLSTVMAALNSGKLLQTMIECDDRTFALTFAPVADAGYVNVYGLDITDRRRLEEQLRQSQKMDAVGQLAGGIAHDFNNQLAGILGFADILANELEDEQHKADAAAIVKAARRSANLTQQLLAFARKGRNLSVPVDVHGVIGEVVTLLKHSIDKRITIQQFLKADPSVTTGDPTQLENAFLNIAINARDAMPEGGTIVFESDVVTFDRRRRWLTAHEVAAGRYVQVRVTDDGCGMDGETQRRIFEPFFTTKTAQNGTGMGLAAVYGIVANHHGAINVQSLPGRGATFTVYLPLAETSVEEAAAVAAAAPIAAGARVLVVDDEALVRDMAGRMLERLGCKVTVCKDGAEAINYYRKSWKDVDLVILDMAMPVLSGRDAFIAMREINPEVKALLSSGYGVDGEAQSILDEGALGFLQKPYHLTELSRKVADALA